MTTRPTTAQLRAAAAKITKRASARVDSITNDAMPAAVDAVEREVDALLEQRGRITAEIDDRVDAVLNDAEARAERARDARRPTASGTASAVDEPLSPDYRAAFRSFIRARGDLSALTPEDRALMMAHEQRAQTAGTTTQGGFTVPTELSGFIIESMLASGPMYSEDIVTSLNTNSGNPFKVPTVNDTTVPAVAHTEGVALTDDGGSDAVFGQKSLAAFGYDTEFVRVSMELAQDSAFAMEALLGRLLGKRLGRIANAKLTVGVGTTEPWGLVTRSSLGVTAASATAITFDELIDLVHSVDPEYRASPKARFMFNDSTFGAIRKLKDGDGSYIWNAGDVTKGVPPTLLGYPFSINQAMDGLTTGKKAVVFGDLGSYAVRKVGEPFVGVLRERFWPDLGIAGVVRLDGELLDTAAVKHLITA